MGNIYGQDGRNGRHAHQQQLQSGINLESEHVSYLVVRYESPLGTLDMSVGRTSAEGSEKSQYLWKVFFGGSFSYGASYTRDEANNLQVEVKFSTGSKRLRGSITHPFPK